MIIYDKREDFDFEIVNFPSLDGDVPRSTSYPPSVRPLCYLLLNHWTKYQIWYVTHCATSDLFCPAPRIKRSNVIKIKLQSQFQRFLYQTLCVFSEMKDIKHIKRDLYSITWGMPQGWDFGALGCPGVQKIQTWPCGISRFLYQTL